MNVSDLGEFGLIARLRDALGAPAGERLVAGIGDDAAAWRTEAGITIATTDTMVEGVHFLAGTPDLQVVGWKALAANVSDIAAMGGTPEFALVTLCLPLSTAVAAVDMLYAGIRECATAYGVTVAGGDVVSSPVLAITIALTGTAGAAADGSPALLRRDAARVGDAVAVTGPLGASVGGLRALVENRPPEAVTALIERHLRPRPRVAAGRAAVAAGVRCAIDISDGLVRDLGHVCEESGLDAELRLADVPVDATLAAAYPEDARTLAATGGEDYELVLVAPADTLARVEAAGHALTVVGRMLPRTSGRVRVLDSEMREVALASPGWDHLRPKA